MGSNLLEADLKEVSLFFRATSFPNKLTFLTLKKVGPAILAGLEEGIARGWLHNITFSIEFWDTQCNSLEAIFAYDNAINSVGQRPHVFFGPASDDALLVAFNPKGRRTVPVLTSGGHSMIFSGQKNKPGNSYYMLTRTGVSYRDVAKTFIRFMQENNWNKFLLAYKRQDRLEWTGDRSCEFLAEALKSQATGMNMTYRNLHLEDYEEERGLPTLEQYIESNMTMLEEVLPKKNSRLKA